MTSSTHARSNRHLSTSRKDTLMQHIELRLTAIEERHERFQADRHAERAAATGRTRTLRHQLGESLVRLGRRIGGDAMTAPAWQG